MILARGGLGIEVPPAGADDAGTRQVGGEGRAVVELGVSVDVFAQDDVEGRARLPGDKRVEIESAGEAREAAEVNAVADVECGAAVVEMEVVLVGGESSEAGGVGADLAELVAHEEADLFAAQVAVEEQALAG